MRNELELSGIPESNNENLYYRTTPAIRKVGVELDDHDIDWVTHVGLRGKLAIAVNGRRFYKPVEIIKAAKTRRNIMSADLDIHKVFCNV